MHGEATDGEQLLRTAAGRVRQHCRQRRGAERPHHGSRSRYDTIRYAVLTCVRKPTRVGLIYRTETTTKNCKTEKLKSKADMLEVTVKVWRIMQ